MFSRRIPGKVYPVSEDIVDIDIDVEAEEYTYDGRTVYRGNLDPQHSTESVTVHWLYDEYSKRVGLSENDEALWFKDNQFSTLLQEDWEAQDKTVWSIMTQEAYEDCMRHGWTTVDALRSHTRIRIVTPLDIQSGRVDKTVDPYHTLFVDDDGVLYAPPSDSRLFFRDEPSERPKTPLIGTGS